MTITPERVRQLPSLIRSAQWLYNHYDEENWVEYLPPGKKRWKQCFTQARYNRAELEYIDDVILQNAY